MAPLFFEPQDRPLATPTTPPPLLLARIPANYLRGNVAIHARVNGHSLNRVITASTPQEARAAFSTARRELLNRRDGAEAVAEVIDFLNQGDDASLDAQLQVGAGGELKAAPTARVAALDLLAALDSQQAAAYSRHLLETSTTSSEEWAVALRNYAWGVDNSALDPFLRTKVLELLTNPSWIAQPTSGFLESFDFVPFTQDPSLIKPLVALTTETQASSVRRAAALALERVISRDTTLGVTAISNAEKAKSFSALRADTMARVDLTRPQDVQILKDYLLSPAIDTREFQAFASVFPQGGQFAGHSLVSSFEPKPLTELAQRDASALSLIASWIGDPEFADRRSELTTIYDRLVTLNESAVRGGYL